MCSEADCHQDISIQHDHIGLISLGIQDLWFELITSVCFLLTYKVEAISCDHQWPVKGQ